MSLGVDRGLDSFYRYGILPRFGDSYIASPLQRVKVRRDPVICDLLAGCSSYLSDLFSKAKNKNTPGSIRRAANRLESAIFAQASSAQANNPDNAQELLIALGECERALARSEKWREESFIRPIPFLPLGWVKAAEDKTPEYRLAASLASLQAWFNSEYFPIRRHLERVKIGSKGWTDWDDKENNEVVSDEGGTVDTLCAIIKRRLLMAKSAGMKTWPEQAKLTAWPCDIAAFIDGRIDDKRFVQLLWGLCLVDFTGDRFSNETMPEFPTTVEREVLPSAFYAQLKLCFAGQLLEDKQIPIEPIIFNLAANGDGERASQQALRRLHGSNVPVLPITIALSGEAARRCAAALLFPLWDSLLAEVGQIVAPIFFEMADRNTSNY